MTPGALATRERVRPPSMTRVIASLAELGFVARSDPAALAVAKLIIEFANVSEPERLCGLELKQVSK